MRVTTWRKVGMLEIGKIKPESINVGRNDVSSASRKATCWLSAMLEMSRPKASAPTRNNDTMPTSTTHEPRIGMSNNRIAATTMLIDEISETTKYGAVLPST